MNTEKNNTTTVDSPEYNKKSKRSFVIIMIISLLLGGLGGYFGAKGTDMVKENFANIGNLLTEKYPLFQAHVMPWVLLIFTIICFILGEIWLKKGKETIATWDGEDNEHIEIADVYIYKVGYVSNVLMIFNQVLFGLATYQLMTLLEKTDNAYMILITVAIFFAGLILTISQQSRAVKLTKQYAPEKKGSVYDRNFQKVWYESCDEAERQLIGDASYQTMRFMGGVFSTLLTITVIIGMFIPIGLLCAFFIGLLWLIMTCYYSHTCAKLEHGK